MTRPTLTAAFALSFLITGPALACPTSADLVKGIEFKTTDSVEIHKQSRPDWVLLQVTYSDGEGAMLEMYRGLYLHSTIPMVNGLPRLADRDTFAKTEELLQWARPKASASWDNPTPGGGKATSGPAKTVTLSGCSYDAFEIAITFNDDPDYTETYTYLTDLGVGLLTKTGDSSGTDVYEYTSIKALN